MSKKTYPAKFSALSRAKKFLITLSLLCLVIATLIVVIAPGALTKGNAAIQQAAKRTNTSPPKSSKPVKPGATVQQSGDSQTLSISQTNPDGSITAGQIMTVSPVQRTVAEIMADQASRPSQPGNGRLIPEREGPERKNLPQNPNAIEASQWPLPDKNTPAVPLAAPQIPSTQFDGATGPAETGAFPPDTMGTVGPTQFVVFLNGRIRTFDKATGTADGVLNVDSDVFFAPAVTPPGAGEVSFTSDPQVRYDRISKRWFLVIIDVTLNSTSGNITRANRVLIALSDAASNGVISGSTSWLIYQFQGDATLFTDYESLGVDADALYIGGDMFTIAGSFNSTKGFVIPKAPMLTASPATVWAFSGLVASSAGAGPFAPRGVDNYDPSNTGPTAQGYFIGVDNASFGTLTIRRVTNPGALVVPGPTMSANIFVTTPLTTQFPVKVPHLGNTGGNNGRLDALDDRLYAAHLRDGRLWTAHSIGVNNTGTTTGTRTRNAARWYELQNLGTTPAVLQAGTLFDNTAPNDVNQRSYWIPSAMVSGQGHVALGCSIAGTSERINAFTTGRLSGDTPGTMRDGPGGSSLPGYTSSTTAYNPASDPGGSGGRRWGDYSYTSLDPCDDMTMWTIQEYCNGTNTYGVRVVKLLAPPPATPSASVPATVVAGQASVNITITGISVSGSGFYDPGAGFDCRLNASVTGGVAVNSVTYNNPTSITLNISTVGASNGPQNVTVTNPDGQSVTGVGIITITSSSCGTITLSPSTLPNGTVGVAYSETIMANGGASPYTFIISSGAQPTGLNLSPGGVLSGTPNASGVFNFTVLATDDSGCVGSQAYSININAPPTINAVAVNRQQGSPSSNSTIANVSDANQAANTLVVTVDGGASATINGVMVSGIAINAAGVVTANVIADCTATNASFTLTVTDNASATMNTTLSVTVTANSAPVLTYNNQSVTAGGSLMISPATGPSDNGSVNSIIVQGVGTYTGTISVNNATGVVSISGAKPSGLHTITIRATDDCGAMTDTMFTLTVNCQTITVNPSTAANGFVGTAYSQVFTQTGGMGTIVWSSTGTLPNGLTLNPSTGELSGNPTTVGSFTFTVRATDQNNCFGERQYTVIINGNGLMYYPLPKPIRLFDTRAPIPGFPACQYLSQPLVANGELVKNARITCDSITIPANAAAIVGNATVITPAAAGFITMWPDGQMRPPVSNLNFSAGQVVPNAFTVGLSGSGDFRIFSTSNADFAMDVTGYFAPPSASGLYYHPLPKPIRLFDTRATIPGFPACEYLNQPLVAGGELAKQARITCDGITIPADAMAIVGNATVVQPTGNGFITLWPDGQARPPVSNLNFVTGQVVPNAFTVGLGASGEFRTFSSSNTNFIVDITGYYSPSATDANGAGLLYSPLSKPIRLFDTRATIPGFPACEYLNQALVANGELVKSAHTTCDGVTIPATAAAIVGNATVVQPAANGFITLWPDGQARPPVSNLNYVTGQVVPNAFTVGLNASGNFRTFSFAGTHFIVDVTGFFAP